MQHAERSSARRLASLGGELRSPRYKSVGVLHLLDYVTPDAAVDRVGDLPLGLLQRWNTLGILLDLDNTIVPWHTTTLEDDVRPWLESVRGSGMRICLLSNNYSSMALAVADSLSLPIVKNALKPFPFAFRRALRILMTKPAESVVVGDQLFTDVLGGKLLGMRAVLVTPLSKREFPTTKIVRLAEGPMLGYLRRSGRIGRSI